MITYLKMDLFQSPAHVLVNTINTDGVMGKGIAKTFKDIYPEMFKQYQQFCEKKQFDVGMLWLYKTPNKWVINFPTKKHWRNPSKIEYIEWGLQKFVQTYEEKGIDSIAFPPLGCGNGGLNWENEVRPLMEKYLKDLPIDIYIHVPMPEFNHKNKEHYNIKEVKKWLQSQPGSLSFYEVWNDLTDALSKNNIFRIQGKEYKASLLTNNDGHFIQFKSIEDVVCITQEQVNDVWENLRFSGFGSEATISSYFNGKTSYIFNLLIRLPYVQPTEIAHGVAHGSTGIGNRFRMGITLTPILSDEGHEVAEL